MGIYGVKVLNESIIDNMKNKKDAKKIVDDFGTVTWDCATFGVLNGGPLLEEYTKKEIAFVNKYKDNSYVLTKFKSKVLDWRRIYLMNPKFQRGSTGYSNHVIKVLIPLIDKYLKTEGLVYGNIW